MSAADHEAEAALILAANSSPASVDRANAHTRLALSVRAGEIAGALRGIAEALGGRQPSVGICGIPAPSVLPGNPAAVCELPTGHDGWHHEFGGAHWGGAA